MLYINLDINTKNTSEARTEEENAEILPEELEQIETTKKS